MSGELKTAARVRRRLQMADMNTLSLKVITSVTAVRYVVFGASSNLFLLMLFAALVWGGIAPELAAAGLYPLGIVVSYFGHKLYSFRSAEAHRVTIPRYVLAHGVALATNVGCQILFYRVVGINPVLVQLAAAGIVNLILFVMLRHLVFRAAPKGHR